MNITVYLGANLGTDPALPQAVQQLGRWIGESGNALVYGGSKSGLMGAFSRQCTGRRRQGDRRRAQVLSGRRAAARGTD